MAETGEAPPLLRRLVGDALRGYRTDQGRTLRDVAGAARVSVPYLSEVERGRKEASSEVLAAVCKGLDVRLSDLLEQVRRELLARETQPDAATRTDLAARPGLAHRPGLAPRPDVAPQPRRPVQGPKTPVRAGGAGVAAPAPASAPLPAVAPRRWVAVTPARPARPAPSGPTCQLGAALPLAGPYRSVRPSRHRRRAGSRAVGRSRHQVACVLGGGRRAAQIVP